MAFQRQAENCQEIGCDCGIDVPEVGRVPTAVFFGVVPGEEEIGHAAGLAGVAPGDFAETGESFEGSGICEFS